MTSPSDYGEQLTPDGSAKVTLTEMGMPSAFMVGMRQYGHDYFAALSEAACVMRMGMKGGRDPVNGSIYHEPESVAGAGTHRPAPHPHRRLRAPATEGRLIVHYVTLTGPSLDLGGLLELAELGAMVGKDVTDEQARGLQRLQCAIEGRPMPGHAPPKHRGPDLNLVRSRRKAEGS